MLSLLIVGNSYRNARSKLLVPSSCLRRLCDWTEAYIDLLRLSLKEKYPRYDYGFHRPPKGSMGRATLLSES